MKLFGNRYKKLSDEVARLRSDVGEVKRMSLWDYWSLGMRGHRPSLVDRVEALESENQMLREYLKIEEHIVEARKTYRKKASHGH